MRSIKSSFNKIQNKQPLLGSYAVLAQAIRGRNFKEDAITRAFTKLIPKEEYAPSERRALLKYLVSISNPLEDNKKMTKNELEKEFLDETNKVITCKQIPLLSL